MMTLMVCDVENLFYTTMEGVETAVVQVFN